MALETGSESKPFVEGETFDHRSFQRTSGDDLERSNLLQLDFVESQAAQPTLRPRSVPYLDGLRGLAALLVYLYHHASWCYGSDHPIIHGFGYNGEYYLASFPFLRLLWSGGGAAVAVFFVLSGYVLSRAPLRRLRDETPERCRKSLTGAAVRRPFRLYIPPAGVSLVLVIIMQLPFGLAPTLTWPQSQDNIFAELAHWFVELCLILNPFQRHTTTTAWFPYNPPVWTLPVEFQGSMLVFGLIAALSYVRFQQRVVTFCVSGLLLLFIGEWTMACFIGGLLLALNDLENFDETYLLKWVSPQHKSTIYQAIFVIAWWLLGQPAIAGGTEISYNTWGWYVLTQMLPGVYYNGEYWRFWPSIGAILLVFAVLRLKWLQEFLTTKPLRNLGRLSFSFYLAHMPLLWTVGDRIYRLLGVIRPGMETWYDNRLAVPDIGPRGLSLRFILAQSLIFPLNLLLAEAGTVWLDETSIAIGRHLVSRWNLGLDEK